MGVSFKVSKKGTRFRPLLPPLQADDDDNENVDSNTKAVTSIPATNFSKVDVIQAGGAVEVNQVSFTLDLYEDGFCIRKALEDSVQDTRKAVRPYDRRSESFFSAIEAGRLPIDFLGEMLVKYVEGTLLCEVRDYRKGALVPGNVISSMSGLPVITKVSLRMSLENVVKDIPLISDDSWTYGDLIEVESRILKALQPKLCLDPSPKLERLCSEPAPKKLNLGLSGRQKRRLRHTPEVTVASNIQTHGIKVQSDASGDSGTISGDATQSVSKGHVSSNCQFSPKSLGPEALPPALPLSANQCKYQQGVDQRVMQDHVSGPAVQASRALPSSRDLTMTHNDENGGVPSLHEKRERQDAQLEPLSNASKRARQTLVSFDVVPQKGVGSQLETITGPDLFFHQTAESRDAPYVSPGAQKFSQKVLEGVPNREPLYVDQKGLGTGVKEDLRQIEKLDKPEFGRSERASHAIGTENSQLDQKGLGTGVKEDLRQIEKLDKPEFGRSERASHAIGTENSQLGPEQGRINQAIPKGIPNREPLYVDQKGLGTGVKEDLRQIEKLDKPEFGRSERASHAIGTENSQLGPEQGRINQAIPPHPLMTSHFPSPMQRKNLGQLVDKDLRIEDQLHKRKQMQSPRASSGAIESPKSFRSGEILSGWLGPQLGIAASAYGVTQKPTGHSLPTVDGTPSLASNPGDSMQRPFQAPTVPRRRSNSLSNNQALSGVGSLSVSATPLSDHSCLDKFSKIEMLTQRHQLNCKKKKEDSISVRKPASYSTHLVSMCLSDVSDTEELREPNCITQLSKSLVGGSMNICKVRALNFCQNEHKFQGNVVIPRRNRLILAEDESDGTVATQYGIYNNEILDSKELLPTLPNTYHADLLAAQFCSLMQCEGFQLKDDQIQPIPNVSMHYESKGPGFASKGVSAEMIPSQISFASGAPVNNENSSVNSFQNLLAGSRILPPADNQPLLSKGFTSSVGMPPSSQNQNPQSSVQSHHQNQNLMIQQQQHPQIQRSSMMIPTSPVSHMNSIGQNSNVQLANQMMNRHSKLQHQQRQQQQMVLQQQQQQQQQRVLQQQQLQMQRNMMSGLVTGMGMGNMRQNMVGLGGLGNVMGTGTIVRGVGVAGISGQTVPMPGLGGMDQNRMTVYHVFNMLGQEVQMGKISQVQANAVLASFMANQNHGSIFGERQSGIAGMSTGQMHLGSNINYMQRATMPPPQMIPGIMIQQQQAQDLVLQQQQQQQQQQQLRQQQPQQQQQQIGSPSEAVVSSPLVGSPPQLSPQLQQLSPHQISQQTAMNPQLSSSTMPPLNATAAASTGVGPASPQVIASPVGSITSSPMEVQDTSRSNSASNI
ncbi:hypothetical protein MKW92_012625 [Papaver armeniacum]|nr:hypothetical protein MKW92_012625 [Papaver armeniacum]